MTNDEIQEDLKTFEQKLKLLRKDYDLYFNGLEKKEPLLLKEQVRRIIRKYTAQRIQNSILKFKFESLQATFNTFNTYWTRTLVQMEAGIDPKTRFRLQNRGANQAVKNNPPEEKPKANTPPSTNNDQPPSANDYQTIYEQFIQARNTCQEPTHITFDQMQKILDTQAEKIRQKYNCEQVDFRVVIEDGKTKLKGTAKKNKR